jgi:inner membrane protein
MLAPTHLFFALAIAYLLRLPRMPAAIAGVIPDLDILLQDDFPLMHRGIVHTPFFLLVGIVLLYLVADKPTTFAFGAGFLSHLLLDVITPAGILLLYPIPVFYTLNLAPYNNILANLGIIAASLGAILLYKSEGFQDWINRVFSMRLEPYKGGRTGKSRKGPSKPKGRRDYE